MIWVKEIGLVPVQVQRESNSPSVLSYCACKKTLKLSFLKQIISILIRIEICLSCFSFSKYYIIFYVNLFQP